MAEGVLGPVVLVVTFFSVLTLLIAQIAPILVESDRLYPTIIGPPSIVDTFMEEFLTDWPPSPYGVTPGDADWFWGVLNEMVEFDPGAEEHPLKCWLVRNDPFKAASADYLVFQQYYGWFGFKERMLLIMAGFVWMFCGIAIFIDYGDAFMFMSVGIGAALLIKGAYDVWN